MTRPTPTHEYHFPRWALEPLGMVGTVSMKATM